MYSTILYELERISTHFWYGHFNIYEFVYVNVTVHCASMDICLAFGHKRWLINWMRTEYTACNWLGFCLLWTWLTFPKCFLHQSAANEM